MTMRSTEADPAVDAAYWRWVEAEEEEDPIDVEELASNLDPEQVAALLSLIEEYLEFRANCDDAASTPAVGTFGRFTIEGPRHGAGGMGEVFRARDRDVGDRIVAYKVMHAHFVGLPGAEAKFHREPDLTDRVRHPGVIPIYAKVRDDSDRPAYAMEFVAGRTLDRVIAEGAAGRDLESRRRILGRLVEVARIVEHAHRLGIVHADLKPRNILIDDRGATRLLDWGIARDLNATDDPISHAGTPGYQDPRVGGGEAGPDVPADIYSLGRILAEAQGEAAPRALRAIVAKATAPAPQDRYRSAEEFAGEIERFLRGDRVEAHREPLLERLWRLANRHRSASAAMIATAFLVAASVTFAILLATAHERADLQAKKRIAAERDSALKSASAELAKLDKWASRLSYQADFEGTRTSYLAYLKLLEDPSLDREKLILSARESARLIRTTTEMSGRAWERETAEAVPRVRRVIATFEKLRREEPASAAQYNFIIGYCYTGLCVLAAQGDLNPEADRDFARALAHLVPLVDDPSWGADARKGIRDTVDARRTMLAKEGLYFEALAVPTGVPESSLPPRELLTDYALVLIRQGAEMEQSRLPFSRPPNVDHPKAIAQADVLLRQAGTSPAAIYNCACAYSLATEDEKAAPAERDHRAAQAVALLARIRVGGYFAGEKQRGELLSDADLVPLLGRPDFAELVEDVEAKGR